MGRWVARKAKHDIHFWRSVISGVLIVLGVFGMAAGLVVSYTKTNVVDTEGYLRMVGPLPQEPAVATALGTFTAERLFNGLSVQENITSFLPDRLQPAAPLLSDTLKEQVATTTGKIAGSAAFSDAWLQANRTAHEALLKVAHSEPREPKLDAQTVVKLDTLFQQVRERFGGDDGTILTPEQKQNAADLVINTQQSVQQLRTTVAFIETGAWLFPLLTLLFLVAGVAVAHNRRHALLWVGLAVVILGAGLLAVFRFVSQRWLDSFDQEVYRTAADTIYQAFYGNLRARLVVMTLTGLVLAFAALLFGPAAWAVRLRRVLRFSK